MILLPNEFDLRDIDNHMLLYWFLRAGQRCEWFDHKCPIQYHGNLVDARYEFEEGVLCEPVGVLCSEWYAKCAEVYV